MYKSFLHLCTRTLFCYLGKEYLSAKLVVHQKIAMPWFCRILDISQHLFHGYLNLQSLRICTMSRCYPLIYSRRNILAAIKEILSHYMIHWYMNQNHHTISSQRLWHSLRSLWKEDFPSTGTVAELCDRPNANCLMATYYLTKSPNWFLKRSTHSILEIFTSMKSAQIPLSDSIFTSW